jgi:hypothetical protein
VGCRRWRDEGYTDSWVCLVNLLAGVVEGDPTEVPAIH